MALVQRPQDFGGKRSRLSNGKRSRHTLDVKIFVGKIVNNYSILKNGRVGFELNKAKAEVRRAHGDKDPVILNKMLANKFLLRSLQLLPEVRFDA